MHADQYIKNVISKYSVQNNLIRQASLTNAIGDVKLVITGWAGQQLSGVHLSGSNAKGTAISLSHDVDLFISLHSTTSETLSELHKKLNIWMTSKGYATKLQNVSIGITHKGFKIDLVPAVRHSPLSGDHSLYTRKNDSWIKTNIFTHINKIKNSGVTEEIKAMKIWREKNNLDFPSVYLELSVINAIGPFPSKSISSNLIKVFHYLRDNFVNAKIIDPANSNNTISDDLYMTEKNLIRNKAIASLGMKTWQSVIY